jgi:penicillin-binding protein 1A
MRILIATILTGVMLALAGLLAAYHVLQQEIPRLPATLAHAAWQPPTEIYSHDGERLLTFGERTYVPLADISPFFLNAVIAAEDARFHRHRGIDPISFLRAIAANLKHRRLVQGGSTLTQQLAKNLFLSFEKKWTRKLKELILALQIEATFTKAEILEAYCNQVYFGGGHHGVEAASRAYFGKSAKHLSLLEAAVLAGVPKSPNRFNPAADKRRALKRGRFILGRMMEQGFITKTMHGQARRAPLNVRTPPLTADPNAYFATFILRELEKRFGREILEFGGLRVFTTLDAGLQRAAHQAALKHAAFLRNHMPEPLAGLEAAVVSIDNRSGAVRVMLGGLDPSRSQFNRAISRNRMAGSSFKPIVYMSAFENLHYHPGTVVVDEPVALNIPGVTTWTPENFDSRFQGPVVLKKALAQSLNIVSVKLMHRLKPARVIATARKFGLQAPLSNHYSLALGTAGLSPLDLASVYSVIANLGVYREPFFISRIEDPAGHPLFKHWTENQRRFSEQRVYPLLDMMQGVIENGSGRVIRRLGFADPAGGKTGTTNDFRDAWFTGFSRHLSTSVWVGDDKNASLIGPSGKGLTGLHAAAPIWASFMKAAHAGLPARDFIPPAGIRFEYADAHSGVRAARDAKNALRLALESRSALPRPPAPVLTGAAHKPFPRPAALPLREPQPLPASFTRETTDPGSTWPPEPSSPRFILMLD